MWGNAEQSGIYEHLTPMLQWGCSHELMCWHTKSYIYIYLRFLTPSALLKVLSPGLHSSCLWVQISLVIYCCRWQKMIFPVTENCTWVVKMCIYHLSDFNVLLGALEFLSAVSLAICFPFHSCVYSSHSPPRPSSPFFCLSGLVFLHSETSAWQFVVQKFQTLFVKLNGFYDQRMTSFLPFIN